MKWRLIYPQFFPLGMERERGAFAHPEQESCSPFVNGQIKTKICKFKRGTWSLFLVAMGEEMKVPVRVFKKSGAALPIHKMKFRSD